MIGIMFFFLLLTVGLGTFAFWIYALIEIIQDDYKNDTNKILWFLFVFFLPFVGTIVYFFIGRDKMRIPTDDDFV